jgi:hypothetical protein
MAVTAVGRLKKCEPRKVEMRLNDMARRNSPKGRQSRRAHQPTAGAPIMNHSTINSHRDAGYELRFQSLFNEGRAYTFPCDAGGHVDLDSLSERARINYFYARTVIGREFSMPAVRPSLTH